MRNYIDGRGFWSEPGEPSSAYSKVNFYVGPGSLYLGNENVGETLQFLKDNISGSISGSYDDTDFRILSTSYYILSSSYYYFSSSHTDYSASIAALETSLNNLEDNIALQFDIISDNIIDLQLSQSNTNNAFKILSASYYTFVSTSYLVASTSFSERITQLELTASIHDADINLFFDTTADLRTDVDNLSTSFYILSQSYYYSSTSFSNYILTSSYKFNQLEITASSHETDINVLFDSTTDLRNDFEVVSSSFLNYSTSINQRIGESFSSDPYSLDYDIRLLQMITQGTSFGFFKEIIPPGVPFPNQSIWWDSPSKTQKILELTASFGPGTKKFLTKSEYKLFESGVLKRTIEDIIQRNGPFIINKTRTVI